MTDQELLNVYVRFVPFLAEICGSGCEIVVHDITDPGCSIVAIHNSLSDRKLGDPMTDLACQMMQQGLYTSQDYVAGYCARARDRDFRSATFFIKNQGKLIGMLCVNRDMTAVRQTEEAFHFLLDRFHMTLPQDDAISERLDTSMVSMMQSRITEILGECGVAPGRMSLEEKVRAVHRLNEEGIMMMKGAAVEIGRQLNVSVATVYRYLNREPKK